MIYYLANIWKTENYCYVNFCFCLIYEFLYANIFKVNAENYIIINYFGDKLWKTKTSLLQGAVYIRYFLKDFLIYYCLDWR